MPLDGRRGEVRTKETNLGDVVGDAYLYEARRRAGEFGAPRADISITNSGGIRNDSIVGAGATPSATQPVTELNTFEILPFTNFLVVGQDVTPAKLKAVLENAVSRIPAADGRFPQIGGFRFTYNASAAAGSRVRDVTLTNDDATTADDELVIDEGAIVAPSRTIDVATIDFLANGGDQYPFAGVTFTRVESSYQRALVNYVRNADGLNGRVPAARYPAGGTGRITTAPSGV